MKGMSTVSLVILMVLVGMAVILGVVLLGTAHAGSAYVTNTIASGPVTAGDFSDSLSPVNRNEATNDLNVSVYGATWAGTVTLQRKFSDDATWYDVDTWTANSQQRLIDTEKGTAYRIGVKQGEYTSGSVEVRLSK